MVAFVKALADAERLRIIGLLAQKPARLSEIAADMGLHPADAQRHLAQLIQAGIIHLANNLYELDTAALSALGHRQFMGERPIYTPAPELGEDIRHVLAAHLNPDGSIKTIPFQPTKLQVILNYLIDAFTVGANYSEKEVNLILAHFHPDTAGLRRDLIRAGMLERERDGSRYWRPK